MNDLLKKTFGKLTVLKYAGSNKNKKAEWICQCECGRTIKVIGSSLQNGNTKSCGCLQKEKARLNKKDISGIRFGRLIALHEIGRPKSHGIIWRCRCDCGNDLNIKSASLISGNTHSCGCINKEITVKRNKIHSGENTYSNIMKGSRHYNWKGGITALDYTIRQNTKYKAWRKAVYKRDNHTCLKCGENNIKLHAHHIKAFAKFKQDVLNIDNGATLCKNCHKEFHKKYGHHDFTENNYFEWIA